jgi:hypothetical protein
VVNEKSSVINLLVENARPGFTVKRIIEVMSEMENELKEGVVVSVDEVTARFRNLPIKLEYE